MSNKIIIHAVTNIVRTMTTDDVPDLKPFESFVEVDEKFDFSASPKSPTGYWTLSTDGVTLEAALQSDVDLMLDDYFPERAKKKDLLIKIEAFSNDPEATQSMKDLAVSLKEYFGSNLPGDLRI